MNIRPATASDHEAIWEIFHAVVQAGDAYVFDPQTTREEALTYWFRADHHVYVAEEDGEILGSYIFRANQPGLGSHVANGSYMTAPQARGKGVGRLMGEHSLKEAKRMGFRAMQFNIVVATNGVAVRLWQRLGFRIVGTLPGAFKHAQLGYVDAHVMFRELDDVA
ncbi:acetyltransferase [Verrucomicrobiaceae bacterium SCGC AG-212-N21]|nr:acetyltransferase [Verrucomicrobiaceae bacterium SCGC AG-212-N21]